MFKLLKLVALAPVVIKAVQELVEMAKELLAEEKPPEEDKAE